MDDATARSYSYRLSRLTAEFEDARTEAGFREQRARSTAPAVRRALALSAMLVCILPASEFLIDGWTARTGDLFTVTVALFVLAGLLLAMLRFRPAAAMSGSAALLYELALFGALLWLSWRQPLPVEARAMALVVLLCGVYFFIPNRFPNTVLVGVAASAGFVAVSPLVEDVPTTQFVSVALVVALINLFGILSSHRLSLLQRQEYRLLARASQANHDLTAQIAARRKLERELLRQATTDALTGLSNRRHYIVRTQEEMARARRAGRTITVLLLDIDRFKQVNDVHGHAVGDRVLQHVADTLRRHVRGGDVVARHGGEEFAVTLIEADPGRARHAAERLREAVANCRLPGARELRPSVTVGLAMTDARESLDQVLSRADDALYRGKERGRNCVVEAPVPARHPAPRPGDAERFGGAN